ncbi:hypothetical protein T08_12845 [Trichinella sp. T8]|nr:hypothetical protein T08_12845 [Trichinella sp. T8]
MRNPGAQLGPHDRSSTTALSVLKAMQHLSLLRFYSLWDIWVFCPSENVTVDDCILSKADVNSDSTYQRNRQSMALSFG